MMTLLRMIPVVGSLVQAVLNAFFDAKVKITTARLNGDRDAAVALINASEAEAHERTAALSVVAGSKVLLALCVAFALPLVVYEWKIIVVDIVFRMGTTEPIRGQVADWASTIIWAIFGAPTTLALGHMWFNRKGAKGE